MYHREFFFNFFQFHYVEKIIQVQIIFDKILKLKLLIIYFLRVEIKDYESKQKAKNEPKRNGKQAKFTFY